MRHDGRAITDADRVDVFHDALGLLEDRERLIIEKRLLVEDRETLADIGAELGLSRERVRQLELRARQKLRAALLDKVA